MSRTTTAFLDQPSQKKKLLAARVRQKKRPRQIRLWRLERLIANILQKNAGGRANAIGFETVMFIAGLSAPVPVTRRRQCQAMHNLMVLRPYVGRNSRGYFIIVDSKDAQEALDFELGRPRLNVPRLATYNYVMNILRDKESRHAGKSLV